MIEKIQRPLAIGSIIVILMLCLVLTIVIALNRLNQPREEEKKEITTTILIEKIQDQAFLVTKTVILDQETTIKIDQGSAWSNFWWGQTINAEALIRMDIGVDFSGLSDEKIIIDNEKRTVKIEIPEVQVLDASQYGDITVNSQSGVLKFFLDNNPNRDHNEALRVLIEEAKKSVENDSEIFDEAAVSAKEFLELVVSSFEYTLETE